MKMIPVLVVIDQNLLTRLDEHIKKTECPSNRSVVIRTAVEQYLARKALIPNYIRKKELENGQV